MDEKRQRVVEEAARRISAQLVDAGKLVEASFEIYRACVMSPDAPEIQVRECRLAFMAGAEALFSAVMNVLDPGAEPTERDLRRMQAISDEIDAWRERLRTQMEHGVRQ